MKVNLQYNTNQNTNFKAVSMVQIPRKAFTHPENVKQCSKEFNKTLYNTILAQKSGLFAKIISCLTKRQNKIATVLESPSFYIAKEAMQQQNLEYGLNWLKLNTGLPIQEALDKNTYTFYVFTKEHKDECINAMQKPLKNIFKYANESLERYSIDSSMAYIYVKSKIGVDSDAMLKKTIAENPINKIKINSLDEVKNIITKLEI